MAPVEQVEGECKFLKQKMPGQSKSHRVPIPYVITSVYKLGNPTKPDGILVDLPFFMGTSHSPLDMVLLSQWEDHAWKGHLRYDITTCKTKVVNGGKNFTVQLNENWNSNILKDIEKKIFQSFNPDRLSDMKPHMEDVLFCVTLGEKEGPGLVSSTMLPKDGILIIANENPVEYGHIFLVLYNFHRMPQLLDKEVLGLMTRITAEVANYSFRVFLDYDASRSSDHKYFQASYFSDPLPVELLPTIPVYGNLLTGVYIGEVSDYALKSLVFVSKNLQAAVEVVREICSFLHDSGTAFSLLISDCGRRFFLFPQVPGRLHGYQLSAWECAGYFIYDKKSDFDDTTEVDIINLLASVSLDSNSFEALKQRCRSAISKLVLLSSA